MIWCKNKNLIKIAGTSFNEKLHILNNDLNQPYSFINKSKTKRIVITVKTLSNLLSIAVLAQELCASEFIYCLLLLLTFKVDENPLTCSGLVFTYC